MAERHRKFSKFEMFPGRWEWEVTHEIAKSFHIWLPQPPSVCAVETSMTVKSPPAMQETWVLSLGQEDPLEKGMATHSSILAGRIPWTVEPGGLQSMGSQRVWCT